MREARLLLALGLSFAGCGASVAPARIAVAIEPEDERPLAAPVTEGTIDRAELDAVLDGGLGRFLQHIVTEPHLDAGRFVGHRLAEVNGPLLAGVDLRPGDTLLRVNGLSIERPEQALAAWNGLRVASELTVDFLREGEERQIRFAIGD